ncbi:hypothetical protein P3L10_008870 [Capsicum annuum]
MISLFAFLPFLIFWSFVLPSYFQLSSKKFKKNLPPSPPKLPFIGNFHQLGLQPHRSLQKLSNEHGPMMMLQFGSVPVLIASSAEAASQIMKTQDMGFTNKPMSSIPSRLFFGPKDVAFTPYGEYWRNARSICMLQLLNNKRVQSFSKIREEETSLLLKKIKDSIDNSQVVDLAELFVSMTNDVLCRVALGRKYCDGEEGKKFKTLLLEFVELLGVFNIGDFMPWLAWVNRFDGLNAKVDKVAAEVSTFLEGVIEEHRETKIDDEEEESADFVDILLQVQK